MKKVFYSKDAQFNLTEEEFSSFIKKAKSGEKVLIPRLEVYLSNMFIWAGKEPTNTNERKLKDGMVAYKKFGAWYNKKTDAKIDVSFYPELKDNTGTSVETIN